MTITSQGRPYSKYVPFPSEFSVLTTSLQTGTFATRRNVYGIPAPRSIHIPHWQLRDLVQCTPSSPHSVYYLNNSVLREVELTTGTVKRALPSWEFAPRSFGILDDYVLAGSENGWIQGQSFSNTSKSEVMKSQLSPYINNNICVYTALDGTRRALIGYVKIFLELMPGTMIIRSKYGISINGEVMGQSSFPLPSITVLSLRIKPVWSV